MFDNLPDNVSHSDFDEPVSDQYLEYALEQIPEWLKDIDDDYIAEVIQDDFANGVDIEATINKLKDEVTGVLVEKYMDHFDKLFADHMSDYIPDRYRVKWNKFTDKLELHLRYTPDDDYLVASVNCFKDKDGNSDDHHHLTILGRASGILFYEVESFETDITGDLEQDALYFSSKLMQIVSRAESYYNKL